MFLRIDLKSEGIYGDVHLNNCINYIYNNPVKAKNL